MRIIANIRVGRPDTTPSLPSHTTGVRQGNRPHSVLGDSGHSRSGRKGAGRPTGRVNPQRSTGVNAEQRKPIDPDMPHLTPA